MRHVVCLALMVGWVAPASAQTFTPLSGPNTPVPSPVCDLINFGFCPQPAPPPLPFPDPNVVADERPLPPPPVHHTRHRHSHVQRD